MKKLILTFDDGPDSRYTGKLLDLLKQENIKATFFVVAKNAMNCPEIIQRMKQEGHVVALHSLEHRHAFLCSYRYMKKDFAESIKILNQLGCDTVYYRPPWGVQNLFTKKMLEKHHLKLVLWDVMAQDWKAGSTPEMIAEKIEKRVFDHAVICLHDAGEKTGGAKGAPLNTIQALQIVLPKLKAKGYDFITMKEYKSACLKG